MRIPNKENVGYSKVLNDLFGDIETAYSRSISPSLATGEVNVMLQDGSVTKTSTFDPITVIRFYQSFLKELKHWEASDIQETTGELNRIFCQISTTLDKYTIKGYFGIQFNVLLYYKPVKEVMRIQKELFDISVKKTSLVDSVAHIGNNTIRKELEKLSLDDLEFEDLFERLLQNQELIDKLENKIKNVEELYPELDSSERKKNLLVNELDNLIMKVYQVSPISIDYNRLMQGEEGIIVYFDIEAKVEGKGKNSNKSVNFKRINSSMKKKISDILNEIYSTLNKRCS